MISAGITADAPSNSRFADRSVNVLLTGLWLTALLTLRPALIGARTLPLDGPHLATVDPNVAPWWELTVLPRIGEHIAHGIVRYRGSVADSAGPVEDFRAFRCPADLERVSGIGPVTVQRTARYLRF